MVKIAKKGLVFQRILTNCKSHNCNTCNHPDKNTFSEYKGVLLLEKDNGSSRGDQSKLIKLKELWLLEDGRFVTTDYIEDISYWQNAWNEANRYINENDFVIEEWDVDDIVKSVENNLKERLIRLGERTKNQKERLEKLQGLKL